MCGRFTLSKKAVQLMDELQGFLFDEHIEPRFNVAPTQPVVALLNDQSGKSTFLQWGLVPPWADDPKMGSRMINARAETLREKASFKKPYQRKRCLIPATGFYEWQTVPGQRLKQPQYFSREDGEAFTLGGLWEEWHEKEGGLLMTCTIITTAANRLVAPIQDRMPAVIRPEHREAWVDPFFDKEDTLDKWIAPYEWTGMKVHPVGYGVNRVANDEPSLIEQVKTQGELW